MLLNEGTESSLDDRIDALASTAAQVITTSWWGLASLVMMLVSIWHAAEPALLHRAAVEMLAALGCFATGWARIRLLGPVPPDKGWSCRATQAVGALRGR